MSTLGKKLKKLRSRKKLSQEEVARILRIEVALYQQYETDEIEKGDIPQFYIKKLADCFNVSVEELLTDDDFKFQSKKLVEFCKRKKGLVIASALGVVLIATATCLFIFVPSLWSFASQSPPENTETSLESMEATIRMNEEVSPRLVSAAVENPSKDYKRALRSEEQLDYEKADGYYKLAIAEEKELNGDSSQDLFSIYNNHACLLLRMGKYDEAISELKTVLNNNSDKENSTETGAAAYATLGAAYHFKGEYSEAQENYKKALDIQKRVLGTEHVATATVYYNFALVYLNEGNLEKALDCYKKALDIQKAVLGTEHADTAATYAGFGRLYHEMGDLEKSLDCYKKALNIQKTVLGTEHADTAATYVGFARLYYEQGDLEKALDCYKKALAIQKEVLGTKHFDTAATYVGLGRVFFEQGDFEKALECYQKALDLNVIVLGEEHPVTEELRKVLEAVTNAADNT